MVQFLSINFFSWIPIFVRFFKGPVFLCHSVLSLYITLKSFAVSLFWFQEFVTCPNAAEALKEFCAANETDVTVIMGMCVDGDLIRRDIAVFHLSEPEVAHEVCIGTFVMTRTFYHKIFYMILPTIWSGR